MRIRSFMLDRRAAAVAAVAVMAVSAAGCSADRGGSGGYPRRDVQVVVPYPAGSGIDTTTRALVDVINDDDFGARLQVVNREGGAGSVGTTAVLNAKPDGYTVGVVPDGPLTLIPQAQEVSYDPEKLTVINEIVTSPIMFVVPDGSPFEDLDDLLAAAKSSPGRVTLAEGPLNYRIPADVVEQQTGVTFKRVKFDGDQATTTALLGDNVQVGVMQLASALPQLTSGKLRALAITSEEPVEMVPDVPTFASAGIDLQWLAYNDFIAPDGLDPAVKDKLARAVAKAVKSPAFAAAAEKLGLIVSGAGPDEAAAHLKEKTSSAADVLGASR